MEEPFTISTPDNKKISAILHTPTAPTKTLIVLVHGLTGHMYEFVHIEFARFCAKSGVAALRFNQYDETSHGRKFHESTIRLHVADTKTVINYARSRGYTDIAVVGHSLGGPIAIEACDEDIRWLILWDPTGWPAERILDWEFRDKKLGIAYLNWEKKIILGEEWIQDAKTFPDPRKRIGTLKMPIKIIAANDGGMMKFCEEYHNAVGRDHSYVILKNTGHLFVEEGAIERLCVETLGWIK